MKILFVSFMVTTFIFGLGLLSIMLLLGRIALAKVKGNLN
jgi:hypothetical protein